MLQRMPLYSAANPIVTPLLRSPLHWLCSGTLALLTVTGRKTGRRHTFPIMYVRDGATIAIVAGWASKKRWWKNVVGGADVELLIRGKPVRGRATALVDDPIERGNITASETQEVANYLPNAVCLLKDRPQSSDALLVFAAAVEKVFRTSDDHTQR